MSGGGAVTDGPVALAHDQAATVHGAYRFVERRLFELAGAWAPLVGPDPAASVLLDEASLQHAWHAELWAARLPVLDGVDPEALTVPPAGTEALFARLAGLGSATAPGVGADGPAVAGDPGVATDEPEAAVARLSGLYDVVVPLLLASYEHHLEVAAAVTDRPTVRALELARADDAALCASASRLLNRLGAEPQLAAHRRSVAAHLAEVAPPAGMLVAIPTSRLVGG